MTSSLAPAQVLYGGLVGTVSDDTGAVIPNASVTLANPGTGQAWKTNTNQAGMYSFTNLPPGTYELTASAQGFITSTERNVQLTANTTLRGDVRLAVGQVNERVTVESSISNLQTEKADINVQISSSAIADLPLPRYRNYQSLVNLVPGATPGQFQNANTDSPARSLSTNVNGTNRNNNGTKVDGAINTNVWLTSHTAYVPGAETIETVNVATNNFDAEQGMAGGAAITVITKSGTNDLHGSVFALHENSIFRARDYFFRGDKTPKSLVSIGGYTIGGPIVKNKLFFFNAWEGTRERINFPGVYTVPTEDQRAGNFSSYKTTIYDPLTGNADGTGRTPFANNIVPLERQSEATRKLQALLPLPNGSGTANNYTNSGTDSLSRDTWDLKINYNKSESLTMWGKYSAMHALVQGANAFGAAGGPCMCSGGAGTGDTLVQLATFGHTKTFSPTFLWDGTIGWTRNGQFVTPNSFGENLGLTMLGIPGTNNGGGDIRYSGLPIFRIDGYDSLGAVETWMPISRGDTSWTVAQNFSWLKGPHEVRFGLEGIRSNLNHFQPGDPGPAGSFSFTNGITGLRGGPATNQYNAWAAFLLGLPNQMGTSIQNIKNTAFDSSYGFYVRDRWRVNNSLTVSAGLRYELYPMMTRGGYGGVEQYDPETNLMKIGGLGGNPRTLGITTNKLLFAPRLGIAYRVNHATVIRSGYGIAINPMPLARPLRGFFPLTLRSTFEAPNTYVPYRPIEEGIPPFAGLDLSSGEIQATRSDRITIIPNEIDRGYIQSWNFIIERELPGQFVTSVGYVGTRTVRSFGYRDINASSPGQGSKGRILYQRFGRTAQTDYFNGIFDANYHALQATINRRLSGGLMLKGSYTYSKAMNMQDDDGKEGTLWNWDPVYGRNRAQAGYNIPHIFTLGFVYDLPFGKGKRLATAGLAGTLLGGWQINGMFTAYQGRPFTVTASGTALNAPGNQQTADQVKPDVEKIGAVSQFYDKTAFAPVTRTTGTIADFGNTGRNLLRGPGLVNLDMSLFRDFAMGERYKLQFRGEVFNISNTPHFANPSANVNAGSFMQISSTDPNAPNRSLRFGLKFSF